MTRPVSRELPLMVLVVSVAVASSAFVASASLPIALGLIGLLALAVVLLTRPGPRMLVGLAIMLQLASAVDLGRSSPTYAVLVRVLAVGACLLTLSMARQTRDNTRVLYPVWLWGTLAFLWVGAASGISARWLFGIIILGLTCAALIAVGRHVSAPDMGAALDVALIVSYLVCYGAAVIGVFTPIEAGRLEGAFANANTLGFLAGLGVVRFVVDDRRGTRSRLMLVLALPAAILSGSRAPVAALAVAVVIAGFHSVLVAGGRGRRILGMTLGAAAIAMAFVTQLSDVDLTVLRTNDSREAGFDYALREAVITAGRGHGFEQGTVEVASTPFRWLADGGYPGLLFVLLAYVSAFLLAWRIDWRATLVVVFGIVHSVFEGWYFAGGSTLFFVQWTALLSVVPSASRLRREDANSPTGTDFQPTLRPRREFLGRLSHR